MSEVVLVPLFGVYDFINLSLKLALRASMLAKESRKDWILASTSLNALVTFFGNENNASELRRSVECPTLFSSDSTHNNLFEYMTTSHSASLLVISHQIHLTNKYLEKIKLPLSSFVGLILDDLQQRFGSRDDGMGTEGSQKPNSKNLDQAASLKKTFEMFAVVQEAADVDITHHASKVSFATKNESTYLMGLEDWLHAVEYLELMDDTEDHCITKSEAINIFQKVSGADEPALISFSEFRWALIRVGKQLGLQLNSMIHNCLQIAQLHRLFNFYAAGAVASSAGAPVGSGAIGQRARTLDMQVLPGQMCGRGK